MYGYVTVGGGVLPLYRDAVGVFYSSSRRHFPIAWNHMTVCKQMNIIK